MFVGDAGAEPPTLGACGLSILNLGLWISESVGSRVKHLGTRQRQQWVSCVKPDARRNSNIGNSLWLAFGYGPAHCGGATRLIVEGFDKTCKILGDGVSKVLWVSVVRPYIGNNPFC